MGAVRRKTLAVGFAVALFLGVAVYFRLWSIDSTDSSFTADDREILRRQFERASMDAMDESAEWRMKYDAELDKSKRIQAEFLKVKGALESANGRLSTLRKENADLRKEVESLKQEVKARQQDCKCSHRRS